MEFKSHFDTYKTSANEKVDGYYYKDILINLSLSEKQTIELKKYE